MAPKLNNVEVTLNCFIATSSESVNLGKTLVWSSGLPILPGAGFMENTLMRLLQK